MRSCVTPGVTSIRLWIYYGHFSYNGEVHEGVHEPIISKQSFDAVEAVLNRRWRYSPSENKDEPKAFLGLLRCVDCGMGITCEVQKGHTYYRCTKKNKLKWCGQPYQAVEKRFFRHFLFKKPNDFEGHFSKTRLFQQPAMSAKKT